MTCVPLVAIDIGNSRTKLGVFESPLVATPIPEPSEVLIWQQHESVGFPDVVPQQLVVSSVVPEAYRALVDLLPSDWPESKQLTNADFAVVSDVDEPQKVGVDRIANAAAAGLVSPGRPTIVIDAGTAITIDLLDDAGHFRGGAIVPGMQLAADSLTRRTAQLPTVKMANADAVRLPARNTRDAIVGGVQPFVSHGVRGVVDDMRNQLDEEPRCITTGGDGELLATGLADATFVPWLTLSGCALAQVAE